MIKVSVFYPNQEGKTFDIDYYCDKHMPMVQAKLGPACKRMAVEQGSSGLSPGSGPVHVAMGHFYFDSVEAFQQALEPHAAEIMGDIPNYTDIEPIIQISRVKI